MNTITAIKKYHLKRFYSLSVEDYVHFFKEQRGLCAICYLPEGKNKRTGKQQMLAVDHNHQTKQIRALLCKKCNLLLGYCGENIKILLAAICYLKRFSKLESHL